MTVTGPRAWFGGRWALENGSGVILCAGGQRVHVPKAELQDLVALLNDARRACQRQQPSRAPEQRPAAEPGDNPRGAMGGASRLS